MIKKFVERWEANKAKIQESFEKKFPEEYIDIVKTVVENITSDEYDKYSIDPKRIHKIDDGDYQGTLLFIIAEKGYQPSRYYYVKVSYGSCSGCDTLEDLASTNRYGDEGGSPKAVEGLMTLALHIVQGLKEMGEEPV